MSTPTSEIEKTVVHEVEKAPEEAEANKNKEAGEPEKREDHPPASSDSHGLVDPSAAEGSPPELPAVRSEPPANVPSPQASEVQASATTSNAEKANSSEGNEKPCSEGEREGKTRARTSARQRGKKIDAERAAAQKAVAEINKKVQGPSSPQPELEEEGDEGEVGYPTRIFGQLIDEGRAAWYLTSWYLPSGDLHLTLSPHKCFLVPGTKKAKIALMVCFQNHLVGMFPGTNILRELVVPDPVLAR